MPALSSGPRAPARQRSIFLVRHTSGFLCVTITGEAADRLGLPPMCSAGEPLHGPGFTVTVDAVRATTTGISAADRAQTMRALADSNSLAPDFTRPGHVLPIRVADGGVLTQPRREEAALDLARMAGLAAAGVLADVVGALDPTEMLTNDEVSVFATQPDCMLCGFRRSLRGDSRPSD